MKMIFAIVRPEKVYEVNKALVDADYGASTKWGVAGRGKQHGIQVGEIVYDEMTKNMLMIACEDEEKNEIIDIIMDAARTGENGNSGDGRVFVVPIEEGYTISSQSKDN
ncbi:MAG: P-II family nitrogen regulator [Lachnospiraceae bacterium]|nr:P-II family nitrogen regulator [Lachnospiraceae bacterium]